jgi:hypothetical protein
VLRRIACATVTCLRIEAELRALRASGAPCADCDALIARHATVSAMLGGLLARMRCTPSARMRQRQVDAGKLPLAGPRPWDRADA